MIYDRCVLNKDMVLATVSFDGERELLHMHVRLIRPIYN